MRIADVINTGEYLGTCPIKGDIYSVEFKENHYKVVAIQDGNATTLIAYTVQQ